MGSAKTPRLLDFVPEVGPPAHGEVFVYRIDLAPAEGGDVLDELPEWERLSADERARAGRFVRPRDGRRFVRCRGGLRAILGSLLGVEARDVEFRTGPGGKPMLPDSESGSPRWRFNVSHSGELALVAVASSFELGVDLEETRPIQQASRIVESYFTAAEVAEFLKLDEADRPAAFIRGWTRKEAVVKAQGVGLAGLATEFETLFGVQPAADAFRPCSPLPEVEGWSLWEVAPRPGYVATLAVQST